MGYDHGDASRAPSREERLDFLFFELERKRAMQENGGGSGIAQNIYRSAKPNYCRCQNVHS